MIDCNDLLFLVAIYEDNHMSTKPDRDYLQVNHGSRLEAIFLRLSLNLVGIEGNRSSGSNITVGAYPG